MPFAAGRRPCSARHGGRNRCDAVFRGHAAPALPPGRLLFSVQACRAAQRGPGRGQRPQPGGSVARLAVGRERRACAAAHAAPGLWNFGHCLRGPRGKGGSGLPCRGAGGPVRKALPGPAQRDTGRAVHSPAGPGYGGSPPKPCAGGHGRHAPLDGISAPARLGRRGGNRSACGPGPGYGARRKYFFRVRRGRRGRSRQPDPGRLPHPLRRAASDPGTRGGPGPSPLGGRPVWPVGSTRPGRNGILSAPRGPAAARRGLCAIAALAAARSPGRGGQEMA